MHDDAAEKLRGIYLHLFFFWELPAPIISLLAALLLLVRYLASLGTYKTTWTPGAHKKAANKGRWKEKTCNELVCVCV